MSRLLIAVSSLLLAVPAFAQEETSDQVEMEMAMPGMPSPMNLNVKVKTKTKTTRTTEVDEPAPPPAQAATPAAPQYAPAPAPAMGPSDCGAGTPDPGCSMRRNGQAPMDRDSFLALLESLKSTGNEISRSEIAETALKDDYLTAKQLGLVLDQFNNEITRMDVAKAAAPHVVNPKHAVGLSKKFNNGITATDFSKLMSSQR